VPTDRAQDTEARDEPEFGCMVFCLRTGNAVDSFDYTVEELEKRVAELRGLVTMEGVAVREVCVSAQDTEAIRAALEQWAPDGFRDDDGVWHDGPHRINTLAALGRLVARLEAAQRERDEARKREQRLEEACDAILLDGAPGDPLTPIEVRALARAALAAAAPGETEQTP
jgi:hypothetical protein